jgi:hypothetical protein
MPVKTRRGDVVTAKRMEDGDSYSLFSCALLGDIYPAFFLFGRWVSRSFDSWGVARVGGDPKRWQPAHTTYAKAPHA